MHAAHAALFLAGCGATYRRLKKNCFLLYDILSNCLWQEPMLFLKFLFSVVGEWKLILVLGDQVLAEFLFIAVEQRVRTHSTDFLNRRGAGCSASVICHRVAAGFHLESPVITKSERHTG